MPDPDGTRRWLVVAVVVGLAVLGAGATLFLRDDDDPARPPNQSVDDSDVAATQPSTAPEVDLCPDGVELCVGLVTSEARTDPVPALVWSAIEELGTSTAIIESSLPVEHGPDVQRLADDGFQVIVTVGFDLTEVTRAAARAHPDIDFVAVDQPVGPGPANLATIEFAPDETGERAGELAATITETGVVAAVLGSDLLPGSLLFAEGFGSGARSVNPDIEIIVTHHPGSLDEAADDPVWASEATAEALANGADVIVEEGGATGAGALARAAEAEGTFCIGVAVDRSEVGPRAAACLVSSVVHRVDQAVTELIGSHSAGSFPSGRFAGPIELAPFGDLDVPEAAYALLDGG